jgi:hypothetical protein
MAESHMKAPSNDFQTLAVYESKHPGHASAESIEARADRSTFDLTSCPENASSAHYLSSLVIFSSLLTDSAVFPISRRARSQIIGDRALNRWLVRFCFKFCYDTLSQIFGYRGCGGARVL